MNGCSWYPFFCPNISGFRSQKAKHATTYKSAIVDAALREIADIRLRKKQREKHCYRARQLRLQLDIGAL